jgi:4-amino-4-deoxy-L-arabinose transferase-like glycosyltransferase
MPAARRDGLIVVAAAALLLVLYGSSVRLGPALADEFIYLAGARHVARTGSLQARYYDASAILSRGYPHQDVHAPGYVLLLGAFDRVAGATNAAAIALNVLAYVAAALLAYALATALGVEPARARIAALLALLLPGALPYVFWAMAETVLGALVLLALVLAARGEDRPWTAAAAGLVLGLAFLVRESALFALPAVIALLGRRARRAALVAFVAVALAVYAPLSRERAPGGANFWVPSGGSAFGFEAVQAARGGRVAASIALVGRRVAANAAELVGPSTTWTERGILASYLALPLLALARWPAHPPRSRRYLLGLLVGFVAVVALLFGVYVVVQWSGYRYAMFLMPAFLPLVLPAGRAAWKIAGPFAVAAVVLLLGVRTVFNDYKSSRQKRQVGIADYVDRYVPTPPDRIVLPNGWLYGWRHGPIEVISSLADGAALRKLERNLPFDYVVLPAGSALQQDTESRARYQRVNPDDADAPLVIFRRIR